MNQAHLRAFIWLRWRLVANQIRRSGTVGALLSVILTALMAIGGVITLLIGFIVGTFASSDGPAVEGMIIWDGIVVAFVFFWTVGLMAELQRSELLSLDRFLHLPVSPKGAFLINYLGSSFSLSLILFLPGMIGLSAGLVFPFGLSMLSLFPLVATFFLMVTAVTHQFRGWLASMMTNPRRRRAIVGIVTVGFILVVQIPGMWTNFSPAARERREARQEARRVIDALDEDLEAGRITQEEYATRRPVPPVAASGESDVDTAVLRMANMLVPLGWLPYGAAAAAEGRLWPPIAGMLGMACIGLISLRRSYKTTIRLYMGDFSKDRRASPGNTPVVAPAKAQSASSSASFLEARLPWLPEPAAAIAIGSFRGLLRAPELKMMLLTPVIMLVVFTGISSNFGGETSEFLRPLIASGLTACVLIIGLVAFVGNQFGFDRSGFRAFVLSPAPRRNILMGKDFALLPFALVLMVLVAAASHWFNPMRWDHLLAVILQTIPMYLLFCLAGNLLSIFAPMALKIGSGMPARHQGLKMLYQMVFMMIVPIPLAITLIPLGIEAILSATGWAVWFPAFLGFGIVQAIVTVWLYNLALDWQGRLLESHEQQILETVSSEAE